MSYGEKFLERGTIWGTTIGVLKGEGVKTTAHMDPKIL